MIDPEQLLALTLKYRHEYILDYEFFYDGEKVAFIIKDGELHEIGTDTSSVEFLGNVASDIIEEMNKWKWGPDGDIEPNV